MVKLLIEKGATHLHMRIFIWLIVYLLLSCSQIVVKQREQLPPASMPSEGKGEVVPNKGELPPEPELTPEERERLIRGTGVEIVPEVPCPDNNCSDKPSQ